MNLRNDPLLQLRNDPEKLVNVIEVLCKQQIEERGLGPYDFAEILPQPPDPMLDAVQEAIIDFFPSGRASHVREVLTNYSDMAAKTDQIAATKMRQMMSEKNLKKVDKKADKMIEQALDEMFRENSKPGTSNSTDQT